ncbi:kinase-like domain-containing protein [Aspergillus keveii]|uniref:Kinase-like domain-containing protein n=1 Tax=Aspergillus keveii TaxID=714993 RepID=A0ABR4FJY4_9EURO
MPRCFLLMLQRLRNQRTSLTGSGGMDLDGEGDYLLATQNLFPQDTVHFSIGEYLSAGIRQYRRPKHHRFVPVNGGHKHYLSPRKWKRHFWRTHNFLGRIGLGDKDKRLNASELLQAEFERWTKGDSREWLLESHKMAAVTQKYGEIESVAGLGAHSLVLLSHKVQDCNPRLNHYYVLKVFRRGPEQTKDDYCRRVASEYSIASSLHHRNIVETFELVPLEYGGLCGCMEYCPGGDLHSYIVSTRRLWEEEADCFLTQLMRGILYLHEMGIAHRDLKPENLLLTSNGCLKIADFGNAECFRLAWEDSVHMSNRRCGSAPYISPEQYLAQPFDPRYVDIWAAAIIYIAMRAGRNPWKTATVEDECFRDYVEDCKLQRQYFLINDISHVRLSLSFLSLTWLIPFLTGTKLQPSALHAEYRFLASARSGRDSFFSVASESSLLSGYQPSFDSSVRNLSF